MFILIALAVWRISSLVAHEDGPWEIFEKFRHFVGVEYDENSELYCKSQFGKGLICVWCNSIWFSAVGAVFLTDYTTLLHTIATWLIYTLALSTVAIIVESIVTE